MSDDNPYVSLVDDHAPAQAPASGPFVSLEDEKPNQAPTPLRSMPNPTEEADYQGWVQAHTTPHADGAPGGEFHTPSMGDRTVTVDPSGNGQDADLRSIFARYAPTVPIPQQRGTDVTHSMLDEYQTQNSPQITPDSVYAKGLDAHKLGTWNEDHTEFHPPGWTPASTTQKIMSSAAKAASDAYDGSTLKDVVVDPMVTGAQQYRQGANVIAGEVGLQSPESAAAGIVAGEKAKPPLPEFRRAADAERRSAGSFWGVLDSYLENPRATLASTLQGLTQGASALVGSAALGTGAGALGANPVTAAVGGAAGAAGGAYFDTYGNTVVETLRESGVDMTDKAAVTQALKDPALMTRANAAARKAGVPAAIINAISMGAAGRVFAPVKAAAGGKAAGAVAGVVAEGGAQGAIGSGGEAAREAAEGEDLSPTQISEAGISQVGPGAVFAGVHALKGGNAAPTKAPHEPDTGTKPFNPEDLVTPPGGAAPFDRTASYQNYEEARRAATDGDTASYDYAHQQAQEHAKAAQAHADAHPDDASAQADAKDAKTMADAAFWARYRTEAGKNSQRAAPENPTGSRGEKDAQSGTSAETPPENPAVAQVAAEAQDAGEIKVEPQQNGAIVSVKGQAIAHLATEDEAREVAAAAQQHVDERRTDVAGRTRVDQMSPEAMRSELLTHPLTGIPNRRAWDEADKGPAQAMIDADGLKYVNDAGGHGAGDQHLKAIATALEQAMPGKVAHFGGDEFAAHADSPEELDAGISKAKGILSRAKTVLTHPDGSTTAFTGIGLSHGTGATLEEADRNLAADKQARTEQGLRAARGEPPIGSTHTAAQAGVPGESGGTAGQVEVLGQRIKRPASPTEAQKKSGAYYKPVVEYHGLPIRVENVAGGYRSGSDADGSKWKSRMKGTDYGYFEGTRANDGDGVDVFMGKKPDNGKAYVIDQLDKTGKTFDEHKVVLGVHSEQEAMETYLKHYEKGWRGFGGVTELPAGQLKEWLHHDEHTQPIDPDSVPRPKVVRGAGPDPRHDSLLQYLARHPRGLDSEEAKTQGIDPADMALSHAHVGIKRAFRKGGLSFDHAAEALHEAGYPVADENGKYNPNTLLDKIDDELRGKKVYSSHNAAGLAEHEEIPAWRRAHTEAQLAGLSIEQLEEMQRHLEASDSRTASERDPEHADYVPFARADEFSLTAPGGKAGEQAPKKKVGGEQQDLFGDKVAIANQLAKVKAALDKKRSSGQTSAETGNADDLFSQARKQTTLTDIPAAGEGEKTLAERLTKVEAELGLTPVKTPISTGGKLEDAGEKIGGARKDKWAERGMRLSDLNDMTETEAAGLVNKKAVWNPNWGQLIKDGMGKDVAALGKILIDQLAAKPRNNTPQGRRDYVEVMGLVREMIMAAKDAQGLRSLEGDLVRKLGVPTGYAIASTPEQISARDKFWSIQKGRRSSLHVASSDLAKAKNMLLGGWPDTESWAKRFELRETGRGFVLKDKQTGRTDWEHVYDDAAQAKEAAQNLLDHEEAAALDDAAAGVKPAKEEKTEPKRPHLDKIERIGPPVRTGDVASTDFIKDFGFRGLEFGNWAANDERQRLLNHAYEGLHDLARVMGIPPKALSLNGTMGLALGARGGGRFAAHYEPGKLVINMTKINGAGALAHEWGHALDHYLGEFGRPDAYTTDARGASGWYKDPGSRTLAHLRPELQEAFRGVNEAMFKARVTAAEVIRDGELNLENFSARRRELEAAIKERPQDTNLPARMEYFDRSIAAVKARLADARSRTDGDWGTRNSKYLKDATNLGEYWRRPTEMFARAFEAFVFDKIKAEGNQSDYLVHGNEADRFAGNKKGNPYPAEDRPAINAAIQKLADALETRTEGDKETLFRRGTAPTRHLSTEEVRATIDHILEKFGTKPTVVVADSLAALAKDPEVGSIVRDQGNTDAVAFLHPRTRKIYVLADQIRSVEHAAGVLAHEYVTHFGLRAAFGNRLNAKYQAILDGVAKAMPGETRRRGEQAFPGTYNATRLSHRNIGAEEALAYYGQRYTAGQSVPARMRRFLDRYLGMIRDWLRQVMGLPAKFDELFVRRTLADLEAFLRGRSHSPRGHESGESEPAFAEKQPTFFSGLARAVDAAKRDKGTGAEWEATLKNMPGVKAEELQWTGIKDWLEGRGRVTKQEVADYVSAHQVQLGDVMHGGPGQELLDDGQIHELNSRMAEAGLGDLEPDQVQALERGGHDTDGMLEALHRMGIDVEDMISVPPHEAALDELKQLGYQVHEDDVTGSPYLLQADEHGVATEVADGDVSDRARELLTQLREGPQSPPKYPQWATPGGENYRELLLTMPNEKTPAQREMEALGDKIQKNGGFDKVSDADYERYVALGKAPSPEVYRSPHWDERNVLAHIRFDDRTGPNGEKILHIHEVQSDWHQAGRKAGYHTPVTPEERAYLEAKLLALDVESRRLMRAGRNDDANWNVLQVERATIRQELEGKAGVPAAPFKTSWPELAMKRMLRMAAEGGYDKLTWDTGDTNAERYNMQQVADTVNVRYNNVPKTYDLVAKKGTITVHEQDGMTEENLGALLGKDAAQKIITQRDSVVGNGVIRLTGQDLKIGGAGMRGFYDDILPKKVQAIVKRFGSSVERGELRTGAGPDYWKGPALDIGQLTDFGQSAAYSALSPELQHQFTNVHEQMGEHDHTYPQAMALFGSPALAEALGKSAGPAVPLPVHMVKITPAMHDSVMEGQPMFARSAEQTEMDLDHERDTFLGKRGAAGTAFGLARRSAAALVNNRLVADVTKILNPKDVSDFSRAAASRTSAFLGDLAHQKQMAQEHLQQFTRAVNKLSPGDQLAMIDAIEEGRAQPMAAMQPVADAIRTMLDTWRDHVRSLGTGQLENFIENYFPHWWQDQKNAASVFASIQGRRTMSGPKTFLKKRTIPTTKMGIELGLKPITTNPLVLTLLKVHEMQRFISGVSMMRAYKEAALAQFVPSSKSIEPGWKEINDPIARVSTWSEEEGGFVQRGRYAMPEDAARVVNNHLSASALANFAPAQVLRAGANVLNSLQLGFSAFHLGFTTLDAMVSKNALAIERLAAGEPLRALAAFAEGVTPLGAIMNVRRGLKLMNAYLNPSGATPEMRAIVHALSAAGGRIHMDRFYLANQGVSPFRGLGPRSLVADMKMAMTQPHGRVLAATKAIGLFPVEYAQQLWNGMREVARIYPAWQWPFEAVGRITRASSAWIMEHIVPLQKLGVFSDLASDWLRRNPDASPQTVSEGVQSAWRSVDNRLGEMVYDNLFWNRTFKDALHLAIRAVGWNLGTVREIAGSPFEILKNVSDAVRDGKMPALGHKTAYVLGLVMTQAIMGSIASYLYGTKPKELKDYMFPRTGRLQKDGTPERVSFPSYVKDIYEYAHHPAETVMHKANPWIGVLHDEIWNTDYFGHPIYNPDADAREQFNQRMEYLGKAFLPFSVTGGRQMLGSEEPGPRGTVAALGPYFGLTPAPGLITKPEKIEEFQHYQDEVGWQKKLKYELKKAIEAGDKVKAADLRKQLSEENMTLRRGHTQYLQDKAKARKEQLSGHTSQLLETVTPLIDSSASHAEMAQRIEAAGYPALAGLIGSLPPTLRPQMKARLQEYV